MHLPHVLLLGRDADPEIIEAPPAKLVAGWTGATAREGSELVHEMAHHVQNLTGRSYACGGAREAEAYRMQDRWLTERGSSLAQVFGIDALALAVLARCPR